MGSEFVPNQVDLAWPLELALANEEEGFGQALKIGQDRGFEVFAGVLAIPSEE